MNSILNHRRKIVIAIIVITGVLITGINVSKSPVWASDARANTLQAEANFAEVPMPIVGGEAPPYQMTRSMVMTATVTASQPPQDHVTTRIESFVPLRTAAQEQVLQQVLTLAEQRQLVMTIANHADHANDLDGNNGDFNALVHAVDGTLPTGEEIAHNGGLAHTGVIKSQDQVLTVSGEYFAYFHNLQHLVHNPATPYFHGKLSVSFERLTVGQEIRLGPGRYVIQEIARTPPGGLLYQLFEYQPQHIGKRLFLYGCSDAGNLKSNVNLPRILVIATLVE